MVLYDTVPMTELPHAVSSVTLRVDEAQESSRTAPVALLLQTTTSTALSASRSDTWAIWLW